IRFDVEATIRYNTADHSSVLSCSSSILAVFACLEPRESITILTSFSLAQLILILLPAS
ncbi:unnamed protein product, partial [Citrullus colocynthis]